MRERRLYISYNATDLKIPHDHSLKIEEEAHEKRP